jgi:hypothetical protein
MRRRINGVGFGAENGELMSNLDPFTSQILEYVRSMPDDALLELVRAHLNGEAAVLPSGGAEATITARRAASGTKRAAKAQKTKKKRSKTRRKRATSEERQALLDSVETIVKRSKGLSSSQVAKKARVPQTRAASALRELKGAKRVYQGGQRRFARYAGDAKTAKRASERARKNARGPKRK